MKNNVRLIIKILLILMLITGIVGLGIQQIEYNRSEDGNDEAMRIAIGEKETIGMLPETEETVSQESEDPEIQQNSEEESEKETTEDLDPNIAELLEVDLEALREVNEDVIGWICIPDTEISYPLVQGTDNSYYLKHTWKKENNSVGAIFMECQNEADLSDFNTIIYGHNMRNESMFGGLRKYKTLGYWEQHPNIYLVNDNGVFRYDIFSAYKAGVKTITYGMKMETVGRKEEFIHFSLTYSNIETGIVPTAEDKILTLSTCSGSGYDTRWVIQGVLAESFLFDEAR